MTRIEKTFKILKKNKKKAFISFIMAGDPNFEMSLKIIKGLPEAGVDLIEIGIPFTDPMADGVAIQLAAQRALYDDMVALRILPEASAIACSHSGLTAVFEEGVVVRSALSQADVDQVAALRSAVRAARSPSRVEAVLRPACGRAACAPPPHVHFRVPAHNAVH